MNIKRCCFNNNIWRGIFLLAKGKHYIFPRHILERNLNEIKPVIERRGLIGQLGIPDDSLIHFKDASHVITDIRFRGDDLECDIELLDTPKGRILKQLSPKLVIFKPQAIGSSDMNKEGILVVNDNYKLITVNVLQKDYL